MPAFNPFVGRDLEWLQARLREAQDAYAAGKMSISFGSADASGSFMRETSTVLLIRQLSHAIYVETGDTRYLTGSSTVKARFISDS